MKLFSTNNKDNIVDLKEAVLNSLPKDRGLYMPIKLEQMPSSFFDDYYNLSFNEIAFAISNFLISDDVPTKNLESIVNKAFDFTAPLVPLGDNIFSLELFHGPSMAFKDFGARYMAQLMSYFNRGENKKLTVLVATSGDTGGAVASGFFQTEGIEVIILYPSGKVSPLQEKQLTSWGSNIHALEIEGSFDDCQKLVKNAFLDEDLKSKYRLSSANSINIARLIPQSFYYFEAMKQIGRTDRKVVFSIPSGNFGNLTAGVIAKKLGLPIHRFIAATNANNIVPAYIESGIYEPKPSVATISNAMDVGDPSNFPRLLSLLGSTWNTVKEHIIGYDYSDGDTRKGIIEALNYYGYLCDPHGAIAFLAIKDHLSKHSNEYGVFLETAHPAKFIEVVEETLDKKIHVPKKLSIFLDKNKEAHLMKADSVLLKEWLLSR